MSTQSEARTSSAFTLRQLVAILGIIAVLIAVGLPVFSRARAKGRLQKCLSNEQQIGAAFGLYAQDYDSHLPLAAMPITPITWTVSVKPYLKDRPILRCPEDKSTDWTLPYGLELDAKTAATTGGQDSFRASSYFFNLWLSGARKYGHLSAISSPAKVIMLTESSEDLTRDHFHAPYWNTEDSEAKSIPGFDPMMRGLVWDDAKSEPEEIAIRRHNGGFNSIYIDGHAKWAKWSQLWFIDKPHHIYEGAFDPRQ